MVALAVLAPIVASQGGNAATQTMTVAVRALATRELSRANAARVILREVLVGALNGAAFGLITGVVASLWFGLAGVGVVIALAMLTNLIAGALGGILIPQLLQPLPHRPGGVVGRLRDDGHRCRGLCVVSRNRDAVVRAGVRNRWLAAGRWRTRFVRSRGQSTHGHFPREDDVNLAAAAQRDILILNRGSADE